MTSSEAGKAGREEVKPFAIVLEGLKRGTWEHGRDWRVFVGDFIQVGAMFDKRKADAHARRINSAYCAGVMVELQALRSKYDPLLIGFNSAKEQVKLLAEQLGGLSYKYELATLEIDRLKKACEQENQAFEDMSRKYDTLRKAADGMARRLKKRLAQKIKIVGEDEPTGKFDPLDVGDNDALVSYEAAKGGETSCISFNSTTGEINGENVGDGALKPLSKKSAKGLEGKK